MLGGRPLYFPASFAAAMPSRWRSSIISRSNCATAAKMVNCSRVVGLQPFRVSRFAEEGQAGFQLHALSNRRYLLAEHSFTAGGSEVAILRLDPSVLVYRACPGVSHKCQPSDCPFVLFGPFIYTGTRLRCYLPSSLASGKNNDRRRARLRWVCALVQKGQKGR